MLYSLEDVNSGSNGAVNIQQLLLSTLLGNLYIIVSSNLKICMMFNFEISISFYLQLYILRKRKKKEKRKSIYIEMKIFFLNFLTVFQIRIFLISKYPQIM